MYFSAYDPLYHDVYLYGNGNTGYPIALNPNCIIYGASGSYRSISARYRDWDVQNPSTPIPPGSGVTSYPNYYNNNEPLYYKINESTLGCSVHFTWFFEYGRTGNPDALDVNPLNGFSPFRFTETLTGYTGIGFSRFYNNNFSSFNDYYDFEHCFNHTLTWPGGITCQYYSVLQSNTYYQFLNIDHGIINKRNSTGINGITGPYLKSIHPISLLNQEQIKQITNYTSGANPYYSNGISVEFEVDNVYFWGGNDTVAPVESISFSISSLKLPNESLSVSGAIPLVDTVTVKVQGSNFWPGDSSGLALFMKDGELYVIMTALTTAADTISGPATCGGQFPLFYYFTQVRGVCSNHYFSNNDSIKIATTSYFTKLINELNDSKNLLNNVVQETQQ